ncbi:pyrroline-5-carboxylate reductase [Peribacillus butanolivorans]|uniref:pyrroline-5-carboxylate reductase n=1 Tax=Peribacillus butanolivorans TaxID=421767 RepID=UPI00207C8DD9|nr:pyrroline-5-carboxylate reductase [Peribacillus butanolivorans]MCO0596481.1 pyrroline-5-carboxylate reductase [Peribacillus butanolivorans]
MKKIAFIGAGSMAEAIISGLVTQQVIDSANIFVTNKSSDERFDYLKREYGVTATRSLQQLLQDADLVVLAVKPKDILETMQSIKEYIHEEMLFISVVAGVHTTSLEGIADKQVSIVRAMPNTSAAVGRSATALAANSHTDEVQLQTAITLFETVGSVSIVEETQLDAVTGLSGSGPAYIYYLVEALEKSAESIGLDSETAKQLILQTLIGAAEMLQKSPKTPAVLRKEVTSPGGTTEAGLKALQAHQVQEAFIACVEEATEQSKWMGNQISKELAKYVVPQ